MSMIRARMILISLLPVLLLVVVPALQMLLLGKERDPEPWTPQPTGSVEAPEPKQQVHADDS